MRALLACAMGLLLAGCGSWNEKSAEFMDYFAWSHSDAASFGAVPANLVPKSAKHIRYVYNIDSTDVSIEFDFASRDEDALTAPFLSPEMTWNRDLQKEGSAPASPEIPERALVRCGDHVVEFLAVTKHR